MPRKPNELWADPQFASCASSPLAPHGIVSDEKCSHCLNVQPSVRATHLFLRNWFLPRSHWDYLSWRHNAMVLYTTRRSSQHPLLSRPYSLPLHDCIVNLQLVYGNLIDYFIQNVSVISALIWTHIFDCSALIQNFYQLNVQCRLHNHLGLLIGQFLFQGVVCLSILASPENKLNNHFSTETESNIKDCLDCKFNKCVRDLESI